MPVFVDSRIELFPRASGTTTSTSVGAREGWQATLDRWGVDAVVLNPEQDGELTSRDRGRSRRGGCVYEDDGSGSLFVSRA